MLPWSPEFVWDAGHLAFFGAFYGVLITLGVVLALSLRRARADARAGRAGSVAWDAQFHELGACDRACRHELTGELPGRACERGFDCRGCATHATLTAGATGAVLGGDADLAGLALPLDRYYDRGHTFVKPEADGTLTIGLDDLARRLLGQPDGVVLPRPGERLTVRGPVARVRARGSELRVLSPVAGTVLAVEGTGTTAVLRVDPGGPLDARHLLSGGEVRPWALRELERLQRVLEPGALGPALADGGELLPDVAKALPAERVDAVLGAMFLDL